MAKQMQGATLLDLPEEILQTIAKHFDADEWARGPSMTCPRLYKMPLTRLALRQTIAARDLNLDGGAIRAADPSTIQRTVSSLKWVAKRTSAATTSLTLSFPLDETRAVSAAPNILVAALSGVAHLSNLKSLVFSARPLDPDGSDNVTVGFLDWLLKQVTNVEAVFFRMRTQHLPASHITFQHMKHLFMTSDSLQSHFRVAEQLPLLETLCIYNSYDTGLEMVDMSGCTRLKQLVLCEFVAQHLVWDATELGPCPLTFELQSSYQRFAEECPEALEKQAALAQQVVLYYHNGRAGLEQGMLSAFPIMQVLALRWPRGYESECFDEDDYGRFAGGLLTWCMPADGQPLQKLETIIIEAFSIEGTFPHASQLPSLRELVINASGHLGLTFQDPVDTITRLSSLHVFGRPLVPQGWDMVKLMAAASGALQKRGLVLGAVAMEQHGPQGRPTSCMYLRPVGTRELSIDELWTKVEQLSQCRCGACLKCWQRAGCIDM